MRLSRPLAALAFAFATATAIAQPPISPATSHVQGIGQTGSFVLVDRAGRQLGMVRVVGKRRVTTVNDQNLRIGAARAMQAARIVGYDNFKAAVVRQMIAVSENGTGSTELQWPWGCTVHCRMHNTCENYEWRGF